MSNQIADSYNTEKPLSEFEVMELANILTANKELDKKQALGQLADKLLTEDQPISKFNTEILPVPLRDYVDSVCSQTDADPIMVTASLLGTISSFINKSILIENENYFQTLYPNLWMLSISPSGSFKTTALNKGAKLAIDYDQIIDDEIGVLKDETEKLQSNESNYPKKNSFEIKKKIIDLKKKKKLLPDKTTPEALLEMLSNGQSGLILISEYGPWLKNMEKKSNVDLKGIFTHFYDVPYNYNYTTKTKGESIISRPFISIVAVSTMVWLEQNIKNEDFSSGFLARFLLFSPLHKKSVPPALPMTDEYDNAPMAKLREILEKIPDYREHIICGESKEYFEKIHSSLYEASEKLPDHLQEKIEPHLKRWSPYILKIAMIFQFINDEYYGNNYQYNGSKFLKNCSYIFRPISIESLESAYSFVQYAIESTMHLYRNEFGESLHQKKCKKVLTYIAKKKGFITRQQLLSSHTLEGGVAEYDYVLLTLADQGKINIQEKHPKTITEYSLAGEIE